MTVTAVEIHEKREGTGPGSHSSQSRKTES